MEKIILVAAGIIIKDDNILISKNQRKKISDGFKNFKTVNEVLDKITIMELYNLINSKIISYVNGTVRAGKEDPEENCVRVPQTGTRSRERLAS